jgi:uncharacterized SAM-binding protein YcdF (DUF218 family)
MQNCIFFIGSILLFAVSLFILRSQQHTKLSQVDAQGVVVLGCRVLSDGSPSPMLIERIKRGVLLWNNQRSAKLIVTGGAVTHKNRTEAEVMYEYALSHGVLPQFIVQESEASSTEENVRNALPLIEEHGINTIEVVTSRYHSVRTELLFMKYAPSDLSFTIHAAPLPEQASFLEECRFAYTEFCKTLSLLVSF